MANQEYLRRVKRGVAAWNKWRAKNPRIRPNLVNAEIFARDFSGIDFSRTDLRGANLANSSLIGANLTRANLLSSCIHDADLDNANLTDAKLLGVDLREASLSGANLTRARVDTCNLQDAKLNNANFAEALIGWNTFGNNDLSLTKGLDTVEHWGPSTIGIDTLFLSAGQIPEEFLRGAGIPDTLIAFAHSLVGQAIEVASCFISYSHKDREFAERLHSRLRDAHIRVWFAPENTRAAKSFMNRSSAQFRCTIGY